MSWWEESKPHKSKAHPFDHYDLIEKVLKEGYSLEDVLLGNADRVRSKATGRRIDGLKFRKSLEDLL